MMEREEPALISMKVIALVDARPKRELISSKLISCSTNQSNVSENFTSKLISGICYPFKVTESNG